MNKTVRPKAVIQSNMKCTCKMIAVNEWAIEEGTEPNKSNDQLNLELVALLAELENLENELITSYPEMASV
jgi:hypothetical protein